MNSSNRRLYAEKRTFAIEVLGGACVDCGEDRSGVLELHHPHGRDSKIPVTSRSWKRLKEELMKVILLCGNCHNLRHSVMEVSVA